jgi:valyl-tRNA synthetase
VDDDSGRPERIASTTGAAAWLGGQPAEASNAQAQQAASDAHLQRGIDRLQALLSSDFATRAPAEVVERERARLAELEAQLRLLRGG